MDNVCFQQRIKELENRIRKWRFLKLGITEVRIRSRDRRSTSADQRSKECSSTNSSPQHQRPNNIGCLTSPMERKFTPLSMEPSPSRRDTEQDVLESQFTENSKRSGMLNFDGFKQLVDPYEINILEVLGSGSCGVVESAMVRSETVALKTMYKNNNKENMKRILRDMRIMSECRSPFIVQSFGFFMFESCVKICMEIMSTCCEKLLRRLYHNKLNFFPEIVAGRIVFCTVSALEYLRSNHSIIHRDIKPSNILFNANGSVKLCDFGISGYLNSDNVCTSNAGCPPYMSPERLNIETSGTYDERSDIWSLGITIYQLVTGIYPFPLHDMEFTTLASIADLNQPPPTLKDADTVFSSPFIAFLDLCLKKQVEERATYEKLIQHDFFKKNMCPRLKELKIFQENDIVIDNVTKWFMDVMGRTEKADELRVIPNTPCVN